MVGDIVSQLQLNEHDLVLICVAAMGSFLINARSIAASSSVVIFRASDPDSRQAFRE